MKAVVAHGYGGPEALAVEELPVPEAGPGQIQVRIRATALNPADLRTLSGVLRDLTPLRFPYVLGSDFAGVVTVTGPGVTRFAPGDEIFGVGLPRATGRMATMLSTPPSLTTGTMAEYAVFEADTPAITRRPAELSPDRAATLPIPGLTALALISATTHQPAQGAATAHQPPRNAATNHQPPRNTIADTHSTPHAAGDNPTTPGTTADSARRGERVLVVGAAGGVGGAVVPLFANAGAHVIATARPADEDYVRGLGAAEVIGYRDVDTVAETLRRHPGGVDVLVNLALPGPALVEASRVLRPGGRLLNAAFPSPDPAAFDRRDLTMATVYSAARPGDLDRLARYAMDGTLPDTIGRRYPLADAPRAYADLVAAHVRGKLLVTVS